MPCTAAFWNCQHRLVRHVVVQRRPKMFVGNVVGGLFFFCRITIFLNISSSYKPGQREEGAFARLYKGKLGYLICRASWPRKVNQNCSSSSLQTLCVCGAKLCTNFNIWSFNIWSWWCGSFFHLHHFWWLFPSYENISWMLRCEGVRTCEEWGFCACNCFACTFRDIAAWIHALVCQLLHVHIHARLMKVSSHRCSTL